MTPKQKEALEHIHMYGDDDLSHISGSVLHNCCKKGWIEVDESAPFPYGVTFAETAWVLTDAGRRSLADD